MAKIDYKKDFKELYLPKAAPSIIDVPPMNFIMVDGKGDPNGGEYQQAVAIAYALSYCIKMKGKDTAGYHEYAVFPLEGLWWADGSEFDLEKRDGWRWTAMIRQPDFVSAEVFKWAADLTQKKKTGIDCSKARLETFSEGLCVQAMHSGPFADEPATVAKMNDFIRANNLVSAVGNERKHHEIYLSDPRKISPEKMRTVLRLPVVMK